MCLMRMCLDLLFCSMRITDETSTMNASGDDQQYFSNESLDDRNSTTSSTEGSINVERRKVSIFSLIHGLELGPLRRPFSIFRAYSFH